MERISHLDGVKGTNHPHLHKEMQRFLGTLNDGDVQTAVEASFAFRSSFILGYDVEVEDKIDSLLEDRILAERDGVVNPMAVGVELAKINHPVVWTKLLQAAERTNPTISTDLSNVAVSEFSRTSTSSVAEDIAHNNIKFMVESTSLMGLAAMYGYELPDIVHDFPKTIITKAGSFLNPRYMAAWALAEEFGEPAASGDEVINRLSFLFTPEAQSHEIPAAIALKKAKGFTGQHPDRDVKFVTCPGRDITTSLFESYGQMLQYPSYREELAQKIAWKEDPQYIWLPR